MTLPRLAALNRYWKVNPPMHILVAGYLGHKPQDAPGKKGDFADLVQMFGDGALKG